MLTMVCLPLQVTFAPFHSNGPITQMSQSTLLMIRPLAQSKDFVRALNVQTGKRPATLYAPVIETRAIQATPPSKGQYLLFSSVNGVQFYADQTDNRDIPALCVGDTTAQAATKAGFSTFSAEGTASDLLTLAKSSADPAKGRLIYVCGAIVAQDIDEQLSKLGYDVQRCIVYEQIPKILTKQVLASLSKPIIVPVSSPNTARIFADQTQGYDLSQVTFVFISENARAPLAHTNATQTLADLPTRNSMITAVAAFL